MPVSMFAMYIDTDRDDRVNWIKCPGCASELDPYPDPGSRPVK